MISARRLRERAAAAGQVPVTVAAPLTEAEFLQQRYRAKQEAARLASLAKAEVTPATPPAQPEPAPVDPSPEVKAEDADRRGSGKSRGR